LLRIQARLYFGHAIKDNSMPEEAIEGLGRALQQWGRSYESEVYDGAYHSWTTPDSSVYSPAQAERAVRKLTELLAQTLQWQVISSQTLLS
jgi:carboxymethylenebutenolidase